MDTPHIDGNYFPTTCLAAGVIDKFFFGAICADSEYTTGHTRLQQFMKKFFPHRAVLFWK